MSEISTVTPGHFSDDRSWGVTERSFDASLRHREIYGRSRETLQLLTAYAHVVRTRDAKIVTVHGVSGLGKTSLVDSLREPVCESGGFFCAGKFFQDSSQEPYSAIMAAFSDLCDLVLQSEDFDETRRSKIQEVLGGDGQLLTRSISSLCVLLPNIKRQVGNDAQSDAVTFAKFKVACKNFLRAMESPKHPIVLFFDDIQWMDEGSRNLLDIFLRDLDLKNVLLLFAYRDEEICKIEGLFEKCEEVVDIQLANLEATAVYQIVSSVAATVSADIRALSDLVHKRSGGNPFYVNQFLQVIQREGLVQLSSSGKWIFEVESIQREIRIADGLLDLLYRRIQHLHPNLNEALKVASLLGYHFDESILLEVTCSVLRRKLPILDQACVRNHTELLALLLLAVEDGIIEKTREGYQFLHDKLQSAFQSMIGKDEHGQLHLLIGQQYLKQGGDLQTTYNAALHLKSAAGFFQSSSERAELACVNYEASKYCVEKLAFAEAAAFIRSGLNLLDRGQNKWVTMYDLTYEMTESLAKLELIIGNFDACKKATAEILHNAKTTESRISSLLIEVEVRMAANEVDESIVMANLALKALGVSMPRKIGRCCMKLKFMGVKRMLGQKSDDDILRLPIMKDQAMLTSVRILFHLSSFCFLKDEKQQAIYSALLGCQLTLTGGLSPHSANALAIYSLSEVLKGNHDRAYRFGKLALRLLERFDCGDTICPTSWIVLSTISHLREPLRNFGKQLVEAGNAGLAVGDVVYGTICLSSGFFLDIWIGVSLPALESRIRVACRKISDLGQSGMLLYLQPILQHVLQLQRYDDSWQDIVELTGEVMNEEDYIQQCKDANLNMLIALVWKLKAQLACHFGLYRLAVTLLEKLFSVSHMSSAGTGVYASYTFAVYGFLELYRESGRKMYLRRARKYKTWLQRMATIGNPNAPPYLAFLAAQEMTLVLNKSPRDVSRAKLTKAYDVAIQMLAERNLLQFEALANEQAGFAFARIGCLMEAQRYFGRALHIYEDEWGATAKYNWLQIQQAKCLTPLQEMENCDKLRLFGTTITLQPQSQQIPSMGPEMM